MASASEGVGQMMRNCGERPNETWFSEEDKRNEIKCSNFGVMMGKKWEREVR
jgi:hypothetical protein